MEVIVIPNQISDEALDYSRRLFHHIIDWYKNAETKAQVIFTLDGAFLTFLTSLIFLNTSELKEFISVFGPETWVSLALMVLTLAGSIFSALMCIRSRLEFSDFDKSKSYEPEVMWFFGSIAFLEKKGFQERIKKMTKEDEITVLGNQIFLVSKNVLEKHRWVNRSFILTGASLLFFLLVNASYIIRLS